MDEIILQIVNEESYTSYLAVLSAAFVDSLLIVGLLVNGLLLFTVGMFLFVNNQVSIYELMIFAFWGALAGD